MHSALTKAAHRHKPKWTLTPWRLRWLMALYPPLLFNGVRALAIGADFLHARVRIRKTLINTNFHGSIFGGTILCAVDPWFGVLFWQILNHRGQEAIVVVKSVQADFKQPAMSSLTLDFRLTEADVAACIAALDAVGKFVHEYGVDAKNSKGEVVATARITVHIRRASSGSMPNLGY